MYLILGWNLISFPFLENFIRIILNYSYSYEIVLMNHYIWFDTNCEQNLLILLNKIQ